MKKNTIIAAIAAASALLLCASCQKQELIEQNNGNASGKTFTATIEQGLTKTTITSEYKVNWVEGDQIDINGSIFSATPDASDATKASLTKVSGSDPAPDYTAVYPASIMVETQATLPATQTYTAGKFNAPMCAMSSTEALEFKNFCGVLCFALKGTDKVKSIAVTANEQLCGPFEFADATSFSFTGENEGYTVTLDCGEGVKLDASTATNFYVYLPPKDSYTAGMKIVVTSTEGKTFEKTTTTAVKIERNNLYTFDWTASFSGSTPVVPDGFFDLGVKTADGKPLFWAEKNLGADKPEDFGKYFFWGDIVGQPQSGGTFSQSFNPDWSNDPFGYDFKKVSKDIACPGGILAPAYDAATQADQNHKWRTPTPEDFQALIVNCVLVWCDGMEVKYKDTSVPGYIVYKAKKEEDKGRCFADYAYLKWNSSVLQYVYESETDPYEPTFSGYTDSDSHIFLPAAGHGFRNELKDGGQEGNYMTSKLSGDNIASEYQFMFRGMNVMPWAVTSRTYGCPVRPVSD
mgnify:CR=1 FL=1